jgi:hypothetical protein
MRAAMESQMSSRDSLHQLVDNLPDSEIFRAERVLQVLRETADPVVYALENAREDDEPESSEEALAVAEAWRDDETLTTDEVKERLGIS